MYVCMYVYVLLNVEVIGNWVGFPELILLNCAPLARGRVVIFLCGDIRRFPYKTSRFTQPTQYDHHSGRELSRFMETKLGKILKTDSVQV